MSQGINCVLKTIMKKLVPMVVDPFHSGGEIELINLKRGARVEEPTINWQRV